MKIRKPPVCKKNNVGSWRAFTVANDALTVVVNGQHVGDLPDGRRAQEDLGAGLEGEQLEGRPRRLPGRAAQALRRRTPTRERSTTSPRRSTAAKASRSDYRASEDDNVLVQGVV